MVPAPRYADELLLPLIGDLFYYRTRSGMEVDLILQTPAGVIGLEVKFRDRVVSKDGHALKSLGQSLGEEWLGGIVVYNGSTIEPVGKPHLWAVPAHRLLS